MNTFGELWLAQKSGSGNEALLPAFVRYLQRAPRTDAAWAVYLLAGGRLPPAITLQELRTLVCEWAGIQPWLFDASLAVVGDQAETIASLVPIAAQATDVQLASWVENDIAALRALPAPEKAARVRTHFERLSSQERLLYVNLVTGRGRSRTNAAWVQQAVAQAFGLTVQCVAQRMHDATAQPATHDGRRILARFEALIQTEVSFVPSAAPAWVFCPAAPWQGAPPGLESLAAWQLEWQCAGQRVQVHRRAGDCAVWSRQNELLNKRLQDVVAVADRLPDGTVLDGVVLSGPLTSKPGGGTRHGTRSPLVVFDLLEHAGQDLRSLDLLSRRQALEQLAAERGFGLTQVVPADDWPGVAELRSRARTHEACGLMLKRRDSAYPSQAASGDGPWWVWKAELLTTYAVLLYAEASGGRSSTPASISLAVWNRSPTDETEINVVLADIRQRRPPDPNRLHLVPLAKLPATACGAAWPHLMDAVRTLTVGRFGPVQSVLPQRVVKLGFDAIGPSARHKSGLLPQSPQILEVCFDKPLLALGTLVELRSLLQNEAPPRLRHA